MKGPEEKSQQPSENMSRLRKAKPVNRCGRNCGRGRRKSQLKRPEKKEGPNAEVKVEDEGGEEVARVNGINVAEIPKANWRLLSESVSE